MRTDVFKRTTDDWYPSYELSQWNKGVQPQKLVEVSFTQTGPNPKNGDGKWRVCVWGGNNCGMEHDFTDEAKALVCFLEVISLDNVTITALSERGFISA